MKRSKVVLVALALSGTIASAQGRDPIAGGWEFLGGKNLTTGEAIAPPNPALHVICSNGQYVQFAAGATRPRIATPVAQMTKEQLLDRYRGVQGQYGTYQISGNKLLQHMVSAANPNNEGLDITGQFKIEGSTLTLTAPNPQGQMIERRFRRLPSGS